MFYMILLLIHLIKSSNNTNMSVTINITNITNITTTIIIKDIYLFICVVTIVRLLSSM